MIVYPRCVLYICMKWSMQLKKKKETIWKLKLNSNINNKAEISAVPFPREEKNGPRPYAGYNITVQNKVRYV